MCCPLLPVPAAPSSSLVSFFSLVGIPSFISVLSPSQFPSSFLPSLSLLSSSIAPLSLLPLSLTLSLSDTSDVFGLKTTFPSYWSVPSVTKNMNVSLSTWREREQRGISSARLWKRLLHGTIIVRMCLCRYVLWYFFFYLTPFAFLPHQYASFWRFSLTFVPFFCCACVVFLSLRCFSFSFSCVSPKLFYIHDSSWDNPSWHASKNCKGKIVTNRKSSKGQTAGFWRRKTLSKKSADFLLPPLFLPVAAATVTTQQVARQAEEVGASLCEYA